MFGELPWKVYIFGGAYIWKTVYLVMVNYYISRTGKVMSRVAASLTASALMFVS